MIIAIMYKYLCTVQGMKSKGMYVYRINGNLGKNHHNASFQLLSLSNIVFWG